jgi:short-subunit dehydrogenase
MKRVFITGASSGIGRGLALELATPGAQLGLAARRADLLDMLRAEVEARGASAKTFVLDVTDSAAVEKSAQSYVAWAGGVDCVIANAGIGEGLGRRGSSERVAEVFAVNTIGVSNTVLAFMPAMRAAGSGTLVAIGSVAGHRALPGSASYSASKAAVRVFMDALRMDLAGTGVHAMTICPGFVRTPLTDKNRYGMPFLMECDEACRLMVRSIGRRDRIYTFPWQMRLVSLALRCAPEWLVRRVARRKTHGGSPAH